MMIRYTIVLAIFAAVALAQEVTPKQANLYSQESALYESSLVQEMADSEKEDLRAQAADIPGLGAILAKTQIKAVKQSHLPDALDADALVPEDTQVFYQQTEISKALDPARLMQLKSVQKTLARLQEFKAYCVAAKDQAGEMNKDHDSNTKGPITALILGFAEDAPNIVLQYGQVVGQLKNQFPKGLGEYLLGSLDKATVFGEPDMKDGPLSMNADNKVLINHKALALQYEPTYLGKLAVRLSTYNAALSKVQAASGDADNLAAAECLKAGRTAKYTTFLDTIKSKYGLIEDSHWNTLWKSAYKFEQKAYKEHKVMHVQPPAARDGVDAVKGGGAVPTEDAMEAEAKELSKAWAAGHTDHCNDIDQLIEDEEDEQKDIDPCTEMDGEYNGMVDIASAKEGGAVKGKYYSSRYEEIPFTAVVTDNNDKTCIGTGSGPMINDLERSGDEGPDGYKVHNFTFDKKSDTIIWEDGNKWVKAERTPEPTPAPTPPPTRELPYETIKDAKIAPQCSEAEYQGVLGTTFTEEMCLDALKAHPVFNYAQLDTDMECTACILLDGPRSVYEKAEGFVAFKKGIGHSFTAAATGSAEGEVTEAEGGGSGGDTETDEGGPQDTPATPAPASPATPAPTLEAVLTQGGECAPAPGVWVPIFCKVLHVSIERALQGPYAEYWHEDYCSGAAKTTCAFACNPECHGLKESLPLLDHEKALFNAGAEKTFGGRTCCTEDKKECHCCQHPEKYTNSDFCTAELSEPIQASEKAEEAGEVTCEVKKENKALCASMEIMMYYGATAITKLADDYHGDTFTEEMALVQAKARYGSFLKSDAVKAVLGTTPDAHTDEEVQDTMELLREAIAATDPEMVGLVAGEAHTMSLEAARKWAKAQGMSEGDLAIMATKLQHAKGHEDIHEKVVAEALHTAKGGFCKAALRSACPTSCVEKCTSKEDICTPKEETNSEWEGHYFQNGQNHAMKFEMSFNPDGSITGSGTDNVGDFSWSGKYVGKSVDAIKQYTGKHLVEYKGDMFKEDKKVVFDGEWTIPNCCSAAFTLTETTETITVGCGEELTKVEETAAPVPAPPEWVEVLSEHWSATKDDSPASATCADGYTLTGCTCYSPWIGCDGVEPKDNGCTAYANGKHSNGKVKAQARCGLTDGPTLAGSSDWTVVKSDKSAKHDDAPTTAECPSGTTLTDCSCHSYWNTCDGAKPDGNKCTAYNSGDSGGAFALARCGKVSGTTSHVKSEKSAKHDDAPTKAACPAGTTLTGCSCYSPWHSCDGAKADSNTCVAFNKSGGNGVFAHAVCLSNPEQEDELMVSELAQLDGWMA